MTAGALVLATAGIAQAARNPTPPPSGIVVHLFGPTGVLTPILPGDDSKQTGQGHAAGSTGGGSDATNSLRTSDDPSMGDILHQMFVVGDPNDPNKPASGRPGERDHVPASN